ARSRHGTPERAATSSARIPGRLAITSAASTPGSRPELIASRTASRFEPRPETRMPRRIGLGEGDACRPGRDPHPPADPADLGERLARRLLVLRVNDAGEPDPQVEGAHHLGVGDVTALLDHAEDQGNRPRPQLDLDAEAGRQGPSDVVDPAATGDMGEGERVAA